MKKLLFVFALVFASCAVFADDFDDVVRWYKAKKGSDKIRFNKARRIVFWDIKMSEDVQSFSQRELAELKQELIALIKNFEICPKVKDANATIVLNFLISDGKVYKIRIRPEELSEKPR